MPRVLHVVECDECGKEFITRSYQRNICCPACAEERSRERQRERDRNLNKDAAHHGIIKIIGYEPVPGIAIDDYRDFPVGAQIDRQSFVLSVKAGYIPPGLRVQSVSATWTVAGRYLCQGEMVKEG